MSAPSPDRNLAAYCGLYCGACDIHVLSRRGQEAGREPRWSELPQEFQDHLPSCGKELTALDRSAA